ncbi:MAG: lyase family protein [Patescibacteria group bacterium]|jgi:adenylosuccinate lyase
MTIDKAREMLAAAIAYFAVLAKDRRRVLVMHMDHRYAEQQPELVPYLGYDQWALWLVLVEWFWMVALAIIGIMPEKDAKLLTKERLLYVLKNVTTTKQDRLEYGDRKKKTKGIGHDILALLALMRRYLPKGLWKWLHYTATSYDTISTAYALQLRVVFSLIIWPKMMALDEVWRAKIGENLKMREMFRTHLQPAIPGTVGFYLACGHQQYIDCAVELQRAALAVPGKFCGFVGTAASQRAVGIPKKAERTLMNILDLPVARGASQVPPIHHTVRFYSELVAISGPMMSLCDDLRILHMPELGEVIPSKDVGITSTSSAGAAKEANPIRAENAIGADAIVLSCALRPWLTRGSNFQRDLRWSSVMRTFIEALEYFTQELYSVHRQMGALAFNEERCLHWVKIFGPASLAELLHNALQRQGFEGAHTFVKKELVARVKAGAPNLCVAAEQYMESDGADPKFRRVWKGLTPREIYLLKHPAAYVGDAIKDARREMKNGLKAMKPLAIVA